ncbi:hypothetical protein SKAU_G00155230 [Synaphobranchus kaupii]|uniref:Uncharacterized protein n=1 Tax=Synaphobranchus kaupii TaxID=118154 RepID=A0A9Q1IYU5_SYNKA|nr:hypothetical protein SKAU_G00155230 [Synaphobranchus kaupii]
MPLVVAEACDAVCCCRQESRNMPCQPSPAPSPPALHHQLCGSETLTWSRRAPYACPGLTLHCAGQHNRLQSVRAAKGTGFSTAVTEASEQKRARRKTRLVRRGASPLPSAAKPHPPPPVTTFFAGTDRNWDTARDNDAANLFPLPAPCIPVLCLKSQQPSADPFVKCQSPYSQVTVKDDAADSIHGGS